MALDFEEWRKQKGYDDPAPKKEEQKPATRTGALTWEEYQKARSSGISAQEIMSPYTNRQPKLPSWVVTGKERAAINAKIIRENAEIQRQNDRTKSIVNSVYDVLSAPDKIKNSIQSFHAPSSAKNEKERWSKDMVADLQLLRDNRGAPQPVTLSDGTVVMPKDQEQAIANLEIRLGKTQDNRTPAAKLGDAGSKFLDIYSNRGVSQAERELAVSERLADGSYKGVTEGHKLAEADLNRLIEDTEKKMAQTERGSDEYTELAAYATHLRQLRSGSKNRANFYSQFQDEADYDRHMDAIQAVEKGIYGAEQAGRSHKAYYDQTVASAAAAKKKWQDLQERANDARIAAQEQTGPNENGVFAPISQAELDRREREAQRLEAAAHQAFLDYQRAEIISQYAYKDRYSDVEKATDFETSVQAGKAKWFPVSQDVKRNRATEAAEVRWGNSEAAGLSDEELAHEDWFTFRTPAGGELTPEQEQIWYYLYARDPEEAYEYALASIRENRTAKRETWQQEQAAAGGKNFWTRTGAMGAGVLTMPLGLWDRMSQWAQYANTGTIMPNTNYTPTDYTDAWLMGGTQALNEKYGTFDSGIFAGKGVGDLYQLSESILQSLSVAGLGGGMVNGIFFFNAAKSGTNEAMERGATPEQALAYGFLTGMNEVIGETASIEHLVNLDDAVPFLMNILAQSGIEGSEEGFTTILNTWADQLIMGDKSKLRAQIYTNMASGMDYETAVRNAWKGWAGDLAVDVIGGAISGGVSGGIHMTAVPALQKIGANAALSMTKYDGDTADLLNRARASGESGAAMADKLQNKAAAGKLNYRQAIDLAETIGKNGSDVGAQLKYAFDQSKIDISEPDLKILTDGYIEGETDQTSYVIAMRDAYRLGESGMNLSEARRSSSYAEEVYDLQFRHAWELGSKAGGHDTAAMQEQERQAQRASERAVGAAQKDATVTVQGQKGESRIRDLQVKKDGQLQIVLENADGSTRTANAQEIDAGESGLEDLLEELQGRKDAPQMYRAYKSGMQIGEFVQAWDTAAAYGKSTATRTAESFYKDAMLRGVDRSVIDAAFAYGRSQRPAKAIRQAIKEKHGEQLREAAQKDAGESAFSERDTEQAEQKSEQPAKAEKSAKEEAPVEEKKPERTESGRKGNVSFAGATVDGRVLPKVNQAKLTAKQKAQIEVVQMLAERFGINFVLFESETGKGGRYKGINGAYQDGVIYLDVHAGLYGRNIGQVAIVRTAAHELTHFMKDTAPEMYSELQDYLLDNLVEWKGKTLGDMAAQKLQRDSTGKLTMEDALEEVVADGCEMMLQRTQVMQTMAEEKPGLYQKVKDWLQKWNNALRKAFAGVSAVHDEARAVAEWETKKLDHLIELWDKGLTAAAQNAATAEKKANNAGVSIDTTTESVSPSIKLSEKTWTESDYVQARDEAASAIAKSLGITVARAKAYIDDVNSVAKTIADERVRLDYEDTGLSPFVSNAEYGGSFDFTTLCKKRRLLTGTFSAIQNALANTALTANEILEIRRMMDSAGLEVSCGKCYVEGSRASMGIFTQEFIKLYKKYYPGKWAPNMAQMNTPDGIEWVRNNHPEVYQEYEYFWNHYGTLRPGDPNLFASQQKPKLYQMRSAYKGEVLQHFKGDARIEEKNRNGGVRMQSFSDFEIVHLIDAMQVIMDMSRVKLAGQAYTKVPDFAWALGQTGLKINLSIDAWDVVDGKLVFNNKEGMNFEEAMRIRDANSKNVGTICCVYDDRQLLAALADNRIDFIIPFHRSQWKKSQYKGMGLPATTKDYTYQQNEKWLDPSKHTHEFRGRQVKDKCTNFMPNEYWDFSKSGKENAEKYLQMCAEAGKRPKFYKFLDRNADGSFSLKADGSTDGYWKLLIDFKMYDNDGVGSPQMPVRPDFNMKEIRRMLTSYEGGHNRFPVAQGVVDQFVSQYKAEHKGMKFQEREDADYLDAVERGDMDTAQVLVNRAAKEAGVITNKSGRGPLHLYHGTPSFGFTEFHPGMIFLTDSQSIAAGYTANKGYGRKRRISETYTQDDGTTKTLLKNIKNVLGREYREANTSDAKKIADTMRKASDEMNAKVNDAWDGDAMEALAKILGDAYTDEFENKLYTILGLPGSINENLDYIFENPDSPITEDIRRDLERWDDYRNDIRPLFVEHHKELTNSAAKGLRDLMIGFDLSDYLIDAQYSMLKALEIDNMLVTETGSLVSKDSMRESVEMAKDIGAYDLYALAGDNPLVVDGKGTFWTNIEVPELGGTFMTDEIGKLAKEKGYTSVQIKNIMDSSMNNYASNVNSDVFIFFDSSQVKSADPVTYDDNGKVILLSQRFDRKASDIRFQEREDLPDDRELLMNARAEGRNAEALTAYQKKVKSLERLEQKRQRQMEALEAAKDREIVDAEGKKLDPKEQKAYNRKVAETVREQIRKTEASILRAENALAEMERSPQLKQETEKALAAWREANPHEAAKAIREMQQERDSLRSYVKLLREEAKLTTPETRRMLPSDVRKMAQALVKEQGSEAAVDSVTEKLQKLGDFMASNLEGAGVDYYNQIVSQARQIAKEIVDEAYETIDDNREIREGVRSYLRNHTLQISDSLRGDIPDFERWRKSHMGTLRLGKDGVAIDVAYQDLQSEYGEYFFPSEVTAPSDQLMRILDVLDMTQPTFHQMYSQYDAWQASEALGNEIVDRLLSGEVRERETMADKAFKRKMEALERKYEKRDQARQKALENAEDQMMWERRKRDEAEEKRREERALRRQLVAERVHELRERSIERDKLYRGRIAIDKKVVALSKIMLENSGKRHVPDAWKEAIGGFLASIDTLTQHSGEASRSLHVKRILKLREMVEKQQSINAGQETNDEQQEGKKKKGPQVFFDLNPYIADLIKPFVDLALDSSTGIVEVQKLSLEQMQQLEDILVGLREAVDKADQMLAATEKGETLSKTAGDTIRHLEALGKGKTGTILRRFLSWDNTTPVFFFKRFGKGGEAVFRELQRGWGKLAFNARQIIEFSEKTYTAKEAREWEKEIHEFKLVKRESDLSKRESLTKAAKEGGPEAVKEAEERNKETVKLSTAQLMGIYCLAKREQAAGHILGGGIRIWDINEKPTLKERITGKSTQEQAERYLVTEEDLAEMEKALTPRQTEVADALQKYMNTVGTDWGNEVSQARYGVDLFTEKNYYPITTDPQSRNVRSPEADGSDLFHILNMGFTKKTEEYARNGIVIHSIFDVFAGHMADMAKYNSMGLPMLDAMKWINYLDETDESFTSVRKAMETAYGKNAERYFLAFIQDLNGSFEGGRRGEDLASKLISHSKVASVGANLRVAALQPTSYVRALAVLDPKYMYKPGNIVQIKQGIEEAQKYSGTAVWKDLGFFDMNINRNIRDLIKHTDGAMEKVREASMKGAELGDKATWGRLWNATKAEVRAKTGLSGEELLKATAERFDDVIYQTQVMDSTMTRSHLMRQKGAYASMVTSFMSEPTLSYNLLLDAVSNWQTAKRSGKGLQVAGKYAARAFAVYAISQVITSIAESIFDAFRDDDDYEKWWQKFLQAEFGWDGNLWQDLAPYNKLPFLRDAVSIFQGFSNKRMDTEWLEYWMQAINAFKKDVGEGSFTWGTAYKCMRALGTLTGLPISNAARDSLALWNTFVVGSSPDFQKKTIKRTAVKPLASIKAAYQAGALSEEAAIRYMLRDAGIESEDKARQKIREWGLEKGEKTYDKLLGAIRSGKDVKAARDELLQAGYAEETINSAVREAAKGWYQGTADDGRPRISNAEAVRILVSQGGMTQRDAEAKVRQWSSYVSSPEKLQYDDIKDAFLNGQITESRAAEMRVLYGGKSKEDAAAEVRKWACYKDTGIEYDDLDDAFVGGEISESEAKKYLKTYGGKDAEKAAETVQQWKMEADTGIKYSKLQDRFLAGDVSEERAVHLLMEYGGKSNKEAKAAVQKWLYEKETGSDYDKLRRDYVSGAISFEQAVEAKTTYGGAPKAEAEKAVQQWKMEADTGIKYEDLQERYQQGSVSKKDAVAYMVKYGGKSKADAEKQAREWDCYTDTGIEYDDLQTRYVGKELNDSKAVSYLQTYGGKTRVDAEATVLQWKCERDTGIKYSSLQTRYVGKEINDSKAESLLVKYGGKTTEEAKAEVKKWQCERDTGVKYTEIRDMFVGGQLAETKAVTLLVKYGGKTTEDAQKQVNKYKFIGTDKTLDNISETAATTYYEQMAKTGMSKQSFYNAWKAINALEADYDAKGKAINNSRLKKVYAYIDALPITVQQKDILLQMEYTAQKTLAKAPWH